MSRTLSAIVLAVSLVFVACSGEGGSPSGATSDPRQAAETLGGDDAVATPPATGAGEPAATAVPLRSGDLRADLVTRTVTGTRSGPFREPSNGELAAFEETLGRMLNEGATAAVQEAFAALKYGLTLWRDPGGGEYLVLEDADGGRNGGTFVVNLAPARDLLLEAPHSDSDQGTGGQSVAMFFQLGARALILNGAHRCSSETLTTCAPENTFCGRGGRISDAAQHPYTFFTASHRALRAAYPQALAASIHGMEADANEAAVISDGTRVPRPTSVSQRLRDALNGQLAAGGARAYSCNDSADDGKFRPLCGTTNVQGTLDNDQPEACQGEATASTDRFLHVEQSAALRSQHQQASAPDAMTRAFSSLVPCTLGGAGEACAG